MSNANSNNRYLCIHGHFYQPPRENPWLSTVEQQDSAYPFHDWNDRITAECYARNGASRILDDDNQILEIVNNYSQMSFNFGPTLLLWMKLKKPEVYESILQADRQSMERFNGHGSAIAQVFNHMIMPLANIRDKHTQVIWGIEDFESRFNRKPEGIWCGETAVDTETLEVLAEHGLRFTILSPYQAKAIRRISDNGDDDWQNVEGGNVNPRRAYLCKLPSGRSINLFFYDGPVSQGIAFEGLLNSGETFANRLIEAYDEDDHEAQLMHIATDGETYGHHHKLGEMALSYCLRHIEEEGLAQLTVYGDYLDKFPAEYEAKIVENSSWSCYHGVERWRSNCGCNSGGHGDWTQDWRGPIREAFDWLRDKLAPAYEKAIKAYQVDPWELRNRFIEVVLDRSEKNVQAFFDKHVQQKLTYNDQVRIYQLLEMQYHAMLMYTSCGWFFDEVSGIETMQDIAYAGRAIQLAEDALGLRLEDEFKGLLEKAHSNIKSIGNARNAYEKFVTPAKIDITRVAAHYAISSLFLEYPEQHKIYNFYANSTEYYSYRTGRYRLAIGKTEITSEVTWERQQVSFAIAHMGEHNLFGGVREFRDDGQFQAMHEEIKEAFMGTNYLEIVSLMDKHFGTHNYSFWHLFREEQNRIVNILMNKNLANVNALLLQVYNLNYPLLSVLHTLNMNIPGPLKISSDYTVNHLLKELIADANLRAMEELKEEIAQLSVELDYPTLNYVATGKLNDLVASLQDDFTSLEKQMVIIDFLDSLEFFEIEVDLWTAQNLVHDIIEAHYAEMHSKRDKEARQWAQNFTLLCEKLNLKV